MSKEIVTVSLKDKKKALDSSLNLLKKKYRTGHSLF